MGIVKFRTFSLALLLALPLSILKYEQTGIPISDLVCLLGIIFFLRNIYSRQAIALMMSIIFAFISAYIGIIFYNLSPARVMGSLVFLFKPCFAYFVGRSLFAEAENRELFFRYFTWIVVLLIFSIIYSVGTSYDFVVRDDGVLNGDFWGLPLFGAYGVNSLAAFYVLSSAGLIYRLMYLKDSLNSSILIYISLAIVSILILASLSRMAILGLVVLLGGFALARFRKEILSGILISLVFLIIGSFVVSWVYQSGMLDAKLQQIVNGFTQGNYNYISSGRFDLYIAAIHQLALTPLWGASFGGYEAFYANLSGYDSISGLSPHNQYIALFWKMGLPAAIGYIAFLLFSVKESLSDNRFRSWNIILSVMVLLVFCNLWDVLLIPNFAALYYFYLGIMRNGK